MSSTWVFLAVTLFQGLGTMDNIDKRRRGKDSLFPAIAGTSRDLFLAAWRAV